MCIPCGPRGGGRSYSRAPRTRVSLPAIKTKISKRAVKEIILSGNYESFYRPDKWGKNQPYVGGLNNLFVILNDRDTKVKVAGRRSRDFVEGYRTVIMDAPSFPAIVILREKL